MKVRLFDSKIEAFVASLEKGTIAKVLRTIDLLELFGNQLALPHSKKVAPRLFELRVRGIQAVRIFYMFYKEEAVLLHGFITKTGRIPSREVKTALQKLASFDKYNV